MRYKEMVLRRFPNAKTVVVSTYSDGKPRHVTVIAGEQRLEMPVVNSTDWWSDNMPRNAAHAWREAWLWCLRHPDKKTQSDLFEEQ